MKLKLSQKQIGQRIMELRKSKGLSQEDLAKSIFEHSTACCTFARISVSNRKRRTRKFVRSLGKTD